MGVNMCEKVIAIDLDGCISSYKEGWQGENVFGDIIPGCKEKIHLLKSKGHKIIIYTSRLATKELEKYLTDNGIWFDALNENPWHEYKQPGDKRKVIADIYIDDRAITFKGNWDEIPKLVENFKPWELDNKKGLIEFESTKNRRKSEKISGRWPKMHN